MTTEGRLRFCFSGAINDHEAYPRSLASAAPDGWSYRATTIEFDPDLGRPWCRFDTRPGEVIHASSLIATNGTPWVFDTDHIGFVVLQAAAEHRAAGRPVDLTDIERKVLAALADKMCRGVLCWSKASEQALMELCQRHGVKLPHIAQVYPAVVPPAASGSAPNSDELSAMLARLDPSTFKLLIVDGQHLRGASKVAGRKNVAAALECAGRLHRSGARVDLVVVGSSEPIDPSEPWVHALPSLDREDLWRLYRHMDLLLFLSRQESFGYLPMEAMVVGLVCLAATADSLPAIGEIIEHGETGILVGHRASVAYPDLSDDLDIDRVVAEVERLIANPAERVRLTGNAKALFGAKGRFSVAARNAALNQRLLSLHPG
jgi:hypothetical protein